MTADAYIAVRSCGCVTAAAVDLPDSDIAEILLEWLRSGRTVERTTVQDARDRLTQCQHENWTRA